MTEKIEEKDYDKSLWGKGPWMDEPDRLEFIAHGFACLAVRNQFGNWCGYVGIPEEHPYFGKTNTEDVINVHVHGGITYANLCAGHICHIPKPGMPDKVWWLGFDCGHGQDISPATVGLEERLLNFPKMGNWGATYKDVVFIQDETTNLARQLREKQNATPNHES